MFNSWVVVLVDRGYFVYNGSQCEVDDVVPKWGRSRDGAGGSKLLLPAGERRRSCRV